MVSRSRLIEVLSRHVGESAITGSDVAVILGCREHNNRGLRTGERAWIDMTDGALLIPTAQTYADRLLVPVDAVFAR